jgi:hypothetical protein
MLDNKLYIAANGFSATRAAKPAETEPLRTAASATRTRRQIGYAQLFQVDQ